MQRNWKILCLAMVAGVGLLVGGCAQEPLKDTIRLTENDAKQLVEKSLKTKMFRGEEEEKPVSFSYVRDDRQGGKILLEVKESYWQQANLAYTVRTNQYTVGIVDNTRTIETVEEVSPARVWQANGTGITADGTVFITMSSMPNTATPQGAEPGTEFGVGRDRFTAVAQGFRDRKLLVATGGTHGFLGVVNLENKSITPVDLYYGGGVERIVWSDQDKYFAVEIIQPTGTRGIKLYEGMGYNLLDTEITKLFAPDKYNLSDPLFTPDDILYFRVDPVEADGVSGRWQYQIRTGRLGKIVSRPQ